MKTKTLDYIVTVLVFLAIFFYGYFVWRPEFTNTILGGFIALLSVPVGVVLLGLLLLRWAKYSKKRKRNRGET